MNLSLVLLCIPIKLKLKIQDAGMSNRSSIAANFKIISTIDNVKKSSSRIPVLQWWIKLILLTLTLEMSLKTRQKINNGIGKKSSQICEVVSNIKLPNTSSNMTNREMKSMQLLLTQVNARNHWHRSKLRAIKCTTYSP